MNFELSPSWKIIWAPAPSLGKLADAVPPAEWGTGAFTAGAAMGTRDKYVGCSYPGGLDWTGVLQSQSPSPMGPEPRPPDQISSRQTALSTNTF